jgi:hypothetical protein
LGRQVVLTEMQGSAEDGGEIGAVVHHEQRSRVPAEMSDLCRFPVTSFRKRRLMAVLQDANTRIEQNGCG